MAMTVSPADGMSILRQACADPSVQAAQAAVDHWKGALDKVDLSLSLPREQCAHANQALYDRAWATHTDGLARGFAYAFMGCLLGAAVVASRVAAAVPALQPFSGLLVIGSLIATWKLAPRGVQWLGRDVILPRLAARDVKRELESERAVDARELGYAKAKLERTTQEVTQRLYQQAASQPPKDAGKITADEQKVTIGHVTVSKRPSS